MNPLFTFGAKVLSTVKVSSDTECGPTMSSQTLLLSFKSAPSCANCNLFFCAANYFEKFQKIITIFRSGTGDRGWQHYDERVASDADLEGPRRSGHLQRRQPVAGQRVRQRREPHAPQRSL